MNTTRLLSTVTLAAAAALPTARAQEVPSAPLQGAAAAQTLERCAHPLAESVKMMFGSTSAKARQEACDAGRAVRRFGIDQATNFVAPADRTTQACGELTQLEAELSWPIQQSGVPNVSRNYFPSDVNYGGYVQRQMPIYGALMNACAASLGLLSR